MEHEIRRRCVGHLEFTGIESACPNLATSVIRVKDAGEGRIVVRVDLCQSCNAAIKPGGIRA